MERDDKEAAEVEAGVTRGWCWVRGGGGRVNSGFVKYRYRYLPT